jgi:hypothetical protein
MYSPTTPMANKLIEPKSKVVIKTVLIPFGAESGNKILRENCTKIFTTIDRSTMDRVV